MAFNGSGTYSLPAGNPVVTGSTISSTTHNATNSDIATALSNCVTRDGQSPPTANLPMGGFKFTGLAAGTGAGESVRYEQVGAVNIAAVHAATSKATPVDADEVGIWDSVSGLLNKVTWANIKATLKAYFDPIYAAIAGSTTQVFSVAAATAATHAARAGSIQTQTLTYFTTSGTATAFVLTPTVPIAANTAGTRFRIVFHLAAGAAPTLAVSGLAAMPLKYIDSAVTKVAITANEVPLNWEADVISDGTSWIVMNVAGGSKIAQIVTSNINSVATGTTQLPADDTIPQQTEGDQYITATITPKNAASTLIVEVNTFFSSSAAGALSAALFRDATANAVMVGMQFQATATGMVNVKFTCTVSAAAITATTFNVRCGNSNPGTTTFNGSAGNRFFGGAIASSLRITEVLP